MKDKTISKVSVILSDISPRIKMFISKITLKRIFYIIAIIASTYIGLRCFSIIMDKKYTNGRIDIVQDKNIKCFNWKLDKMEEIPCKYEHITDKAKKVFDMWFYLVYGALSGLIGMHLGKLEEFKKQREKEEKRDREDTNEDC